MTDDLISRQAVLDTIHLFFTEEIDKIPTKKTEDGEVYVIHKCQPLFEMNKAICKRIKALSSVSPTQKYVGNALDMRCDDAISRQAVYEVLDSMLDDLSDSKRNQLVSLDSIADEIAELPSVNPQEPCSNCCNGNQIEKAKLCQKSYLAGMEHPQEPKTGHWIETSSFYLECSNCHGRFIKEFNYCPNCGARMESEDEE